MGGVQYGVTFKNYPESTGVRKDWKRGCTKMEITLAPHKYQEDVEIYESVICTDIKLTISKLLFTIIFYDSKEF